MHDHFRKFVKSVWKFVVHQEGQDLVEYALIIAMMVLAATAGLQTPAQAIYQAYTNSATTFNADFNSQ